MIIPKEPILAVVQLAQQPKGVIHQVILSPAKVKNGLIRLGEYPGDEIHGWQYLGNVEVIETLGRAEEQDGKWICTPLVKAA